MEVNLLYNTLHLATDMRPSTEQKRESINYNLNVDKAFKEQIYGDISQLRSHLLKKDASEGVHQSTKQQNYTSWLTMQLPIGTKRKKGDQIIKVL